MDNIMNIKRSDHCYAFAIWRNVSWLMFPLFRETYE